MTLAYDVGVFDGADSAHYLKLGYKVVGIEASPDLCTKLRHQFANEIADGRYTLLNVAIGERDNEVLPFWLSEQPQWNSFDYAAATRDGKKATRIDVPTRTTASIFREHGVPEYIKVDIEGADYICLQGMGDDCPRYLSFEAWEKGCDEMLFFLAARGYTKFSLVQQRIQRPVVIPAAGSLGHVQWSARQWLRWQLRKHPSIHKTLAGARSTMRWAGGRRAHRQNPTNVAPIHACLTPMEHQVWYSVSDFFWLWRNVIASGMIDSSWYDVHAIRGN
jgi:FkbM family methyltransferase